MAFTTFLFISLIMMKTAALSGANQNESPEYDMVTEFRHTRVSARFVDLEWNAPQKLGFNRFRISHYLGKIFQGEFMEIFMSKDSRTASIDGLAPNTLYTFSIAARFRGGTYGPENTLEIQTSEEDLRAPKLTGILSDTSLSLELFPTSDQSEAESFYYVVVALERLTCNMLPQDFSDTELESAEDTNTAWIAAKFERMLPEEFVLGDNSVSSSVQAAGIINRPLVPEESYRVFVREFKSNTSTSSPYSEVLSTTEGLQPTEICQYELYI